MTNLQECLSYLAGIDFDRETLKHAREELADITQRANRLNITSADVERAATLAWNEALAAAERQFAVTTRPYLVSDIVDRIRALKREAK